MPTCCWPPVRRSPQIAERRARGGGRTTRIGDRLTASLACIGLPFHRSLPRLCKKVMLKRKRCDVDQDGSDRPQDMRAPKRLRRSRRCNFGTFPKRYSPSQNTSQRVPDTLDLFLNNEREPCIQGISDDVFVMHILSRLTTRDRIHLGAVNKSWLQICSHSVAQLTLTEKTRPCDIVRFRHLRFLDKGQNRRIQWRHLLNFPRLRSLRVHYHPPGASKITLPHLEEIDLGIAGRLHSFRVFPRMPALNTLVGSYADLADINHLVRPNAFPSAQITTIFIRGRHLYGRLNYGRLNTTILRDARGRASTPVLRLPEEAFLRIAEDLGFPSSGELVDSCSILESLLYTVSAEFPNTRRLSIGKRFCSMIQVIADYHRDEPHESLAHGRENGTISIYNKLIRPAVETYLQAYRFAIVAPRSDDGDYLHLVQSDTT